MPQQHNNSTIAYQYQSSETPRPGSRQQQMPPTSCVKFRSNYPTTENTRAVSGQLVISRINSRL